jgi:anti-sigma factor RsiW
VSTHIRLASLIELELGILDPTERDAAERHVAACSSCRERRAEIRAGIASAAAEVRSAVDERSHVPPDLLAEYCTARSGLGADVTAAVEAHVQRCDRCAEEVARARASAEAAWARTGAGSERAGAEKARATRGTRAPARGPRFSLRWRPALWAAAGAAVVAIGLPFWLASRESTVVAAGMPVRLLGARATAVPPPAVTVGAGGSIVLFIKLAAPPDPAARYEVVLEGAAGRRYTRAVRGSDFDSSFTLGILLETRRFDDGEQIAVKVEYAGDPRETVFTDALTIRRASSE